MHNSEAWLKSKPQSELAKRNFLDFIRYTKPDYQFNWHHLLLIDYLQKFIDGDIKRLLVFMPPQHGKSELVSRRLPAYLLGKDPKTKIVLASYSSTLASSFNRDCQRIIDTPEYHNVFPETLLNSSNIVTVSKNYLRNSEIFETVGHGGFLKTVGVGGSLTGTPADIAIIDDPVKDSIEATSSTYQVRNWNWYNDVLFTRTHNNSQILLTQTRWDENDLSGLLIKAMQEGKGEKWTILSLPAIKETATNEGDPREVGEALWADRHSLSKLLTVKSQSIRTFAALFQQDPKPTETGGEFYKQFKIHKHTGNCVYDSNLAIHLTFDFNVNPYMAASIWQISNKNTYCIGEITAKSPNNTTMGVCKEFIRMYQGHEAGLFIYGDPSGMKQDTRSEKGFNDYRIILTDLAKFKPHMRVAKSAPSVVGRANFINTVLEKEIFGIKIEINTKCVNLIADMAYTKEASDGTKLKEKGKSLESGATYEKWGHFTDGFDYMMCALYPTEYIQYQQGGISPRINTGKTAFRNSF